MNRDQARALVNKTFAHSFGKASFRNFAINLLNNFDELKAQAWNTTYIKDAFKPHVKKYERLGTYTTPEREKLDVLIVHLTNESKLERARTAIRNFVADHLKQRDNKDAALVAFVPPTEQQWRFSYVKMEYAAVEKESGKIGVESRLTPARRFSYIVGEGESCHTAQTRFLNLLQDTEHNPTLAQIEDAFSVEAVTKKFFAQYAALFGEIQAALEKLAAKDTIVCDEFKKKHVTTVDFAKKLMGQIVFLYFLQKKGWLGVEKGKDWGTGPHDFMRRLAQGNYGAYENFFNDTLEPLFYDTLATDRGHEAWCKTFKCRIPFLNGGLFEPLGDYDWKKTDIILPNKLFTNSEFVEEGIVGTGVLDVFDRYNFTVNEAEPLEKEVAIDPEMLGKVFENLIEENRRKGLGSYYTPREIVHYMCQESLINYLDTALNKDNEVVPRADIETFVHLGDQISHYEAVEAKYSIKMPKAIEQHARLIDEKLADITVCDPAVGSGAFPVGMMAEIVRARSALMPYFNNPHDRTPYYFKRHAIQNCLYGVDIDPGAIEIAKLRLWLSLVVDEEDVKQIKPLPNLFYKIVAGNSLLGVEKNLFNQQLFQRLEELKPRYFDEPDKDKKDRYKQQIEATIHELTNGNEAFDFEIYFSEVFHRKGGFDVVIGNPPYVSRSALQNQSPEVVKILLSNYETTNGRDFDLFGCFIERGVGVLKPQGTLTLIVASGWYSGSGFGALRRFVASKTDPRVFVNLPYDMFAAAWVDTTILIASRRTASTGWPRRHPCFARLRNFQKRESITGREDFERGSVLVDVSGWFSTGEDVFLTRADSRVVSLIRKIQASCRRLGDLSDVQRGVTPFKLTDKAVNSYFKAAFDGTVRRYLFDRGPVRFTRFDDTLAEPKPERYFVGPRILLRELISRQFRLQATHVDQDFITNKSMQSILPLSGGPPLKFLLGCINSSLMSWLFLQRSNIAHRDDFPKIVLKETRELPIPAASPEKQKAVERLVGRILAAKARDAAADVSAWEQEIDQLVYALYGLTPEEIALIETASAPVSARRDGAAK